MYYHILILLFYIFYISGNVGSTTLGLPYMFLFCVPLAYGAFIIFRYKLHSWTYVERQTLWIILGMIILLLFRYMVDIKAKLIGHAIILILPALLISAFPIKVELSREYFRTRDLVARFLLVFYVVECGISILEFIMRDHLFGWVEPTYAKEILSFGKSEEFRSVALMGAPLNNALVVTVMMLFYLFGQEFPMRKKIILWLFGLTAVFCFNARMAIVINLLGMLCFVAKGVFGKRSEGREKYIFLFVVTCIVVFILYSYGFGGRLWRIGNLAKDSSIEVRLRLFKYIAKGDWTDYLWGSSSSRLQKEMGTSIRVKIIENFWLQHVFRFGLIATIYFTVFYFRLCGSLLRSYPRFEKIMISSLFLVLCLSNLSIASQFAPLFLFLLCAYAYSPAGILTEKNIYLLIEDINKNR